MKFNIGDIVFWESLSSGYEGRILGYNVKRGLYTVSFYKKPEYLRAILPIITEYRASSLVLKERVIDFSKEAEWE